MKAFEKAKKQQTNNDVHLIIIDNFWQIASKLTKKNILQFFYEAIPRNPILSGSSDIVDSLFDDKIAVFHRDGWYLCVRTDDIIIE